jgi:hypothetical protein
MFLTFYGLLVGSALITQNTYLIAPALVATIVFIAYVQLKLDRKKKPPYSKP